MIGIKLDKRKTMSITDQIERKEEPDNIYFPLLLGTNTNVTPLVKVGDRVLKGTKLAQVTGKFSTFLFSSISGNVVSIEPMVHLDTEVPTIVIQNDHSNKEESYSLPDLSGMKRDEFVSYIQSMGVVGLSGNGFPTYAKYQGTAPIKTLIVNGVECEPYITADYMLMKQYTEEILKGMDLICSINQIEEAYLAIKVNNDELKELIQQKMSQFPKLKLVEVPNLYPMGWEKSLVQYIKHLDYKNLPIEKGIVVENVGTVYAIYEALTKGKPLYERVVSFTGEQWVNPKNYWVSFGTYASHFEADLKMKPKEDLILVSGGPMMGESSSTLDLPIVSTTNCILLLPYLKEQVSRVCMRCGKCVQVCPVKISPVLIKDHVKEKDALASLHPEKCIGCGLCSYICPAKILVRNYVAEAKQVVKGGGK